MKIIREEPATRQVSLNIHLDPIDLEPFLTRTYRRLVNRVQVPGFRKGKAPRIVLENYVGRDAMLREGLDFILPESLRIAMEQEKLEPFGEPDMELLDLDPLSFKAVVPLEPLVDLGSYKELRLQTDPVEVTEAQLDGVLEDLRRSSAPWEPRDGKVRLDDLAVLDVDGVVDGRQVIQHLAVEFVPTQDNPIPFPGFSLCLEGMSKGESKEFTLPVPPDYPDQSIAGKECLFKVKTLEVKERRLPELDDEFAKGVGDGYSSLVELRADILTRLQDDADRGAQRSFQERVMEAVVSGSNVEFSPMIADRELDHLVEERTRALGERGIQMDAYLREVNKTEEEVREELRPEAINRLIRYLVVRKLQQAEGIEVSQDEVDQEIERMATASSSSAEAVRSAFSEENARRGMSNAMLNRKVLEYVAEMVQRSASVGEAGDTELKTDSTAQETKEGDSSDGG